MNAIQDAEIVSQEPQNQALALRPAQPVGLFGTTDPSAVIEKAATVAAALKDVIRRQGLLSKISGKEYPKCEAWTLLGTMLGVFPVLCWTKQVEDGWEARVEARTKDGSIVGAAEAQCLRGENNWRNRDDFALRSMAQTRATAKCLRMPLGFVMTLAGYEVTPSEEMGTDHPQNKSRTKAPNPSSGTGQVEEDGGFDSASPNLVSGQRTPDKSASQVNVALKNPSQPCETTKIGNSVIQCAASPDVAAAVLRNLSKGFDSRFLDEFAQKAGVLLPTESWKDLPLRWYPANKGQLDALKLALVKFGEGEPDPKWPFPANPEPEPQKKKPIEVPRDPKPATAGSASADAKAQTWYAFIVPIPRRGEKRNEYLKNPDTIGALYEDRHESKDARKRLFGFAHHFEAKGWTKNDGTAMPPSEHDKKFRVELDSFLSWYERTHPEEKL